MFKEMYDEWLERTIDDKKLVSIVGYIKEEIPAMANGEITGLGIKILFIVCKIADYTDVISIKQIEEVTGECDSDKIIQTLDDLRRTEVKHSIRIGSGEIEEQGPALLNGMLEIINKDGEKGDTLIRIHDFTYPCLIIYGYQLARIVEELN